jgi:pimeloyl-ACP methyl ester carboxylesterase
MPNHEIPLAFEEHGSGLPVVFIHGFPFDHSIWNPIVPLLEQHARLILPDLRGFGVTPMPEAPETYSMRSLADDILALLDLLQIEQAVLVGHSMGGYVALAFAHAYPQRLAGLGLVSTQASADSPEKRQGRMKTAEQVRRRGVARALEGMAHKLTTRPELEEQITELINRQDPGAVIAALKAMAERRDSTENLAGISVPAVVISGSEDSTIPLERSQEMNQLLGRSWLVEIPGAGHMPMMEYPEAVADALHKFFHSVGTNG